MTRIEVDIDDPKFTPIERIALLKMVDKHEQYLVQGRDLEAHGMERGIGILWNTLKCNFSDTQPTEWSFI